MDRNDDNKDQLDRDAQAAVEGKQPHRPQQIARPGRKP